MPQLPKFNRNRQSTPTVQGGAQTWNVPYRTPRYNTGEEMIAQEAQQSAELLGKVNQQMIQAEEQSNITSGQARLTENSSRAKDQLEAMNEEDIGIWNTQTNSVVLNPKAIETIDGIETGLPTDDLGGDQVKQMAEQQKAELRAYARSKLRQKKASRVGAEMQQAFETNVKNYKPKSALSTVDNALEVGAISEGEAVQRRESAWRKSEFYLAQRFLTQNPDTSINEIKKNPEMLGTFAPAGEGWEDHLDEGELSMGSQEWGDLQRIKDRIVEQREEQRAEIQQQTADEMWKAYLDGDLTVGKVEQAFDNDRISRDFEKEIRGALQERKKTEQKEMSPEALSEELNLKLDIQDINYDSNREIRDSKDRIVKYYRQTGDLTEARQMFDEVVSEQQRQAEVQEFSDHQKQVWEFTKDEIEDVFSEGQQKGGKSFQYVRTTKPAEKVDIEKYRKKIEEAGFGAGITGPGFDPWKNVTMTRQERGALLDALQHHVKNNPEESRSETMKWVEDQLQPHKARMAKMSLINRLEEETGLILSREGRQERQAQERIHDTTGYEDMSDEDLKQILDIGE